VLRNSGGKQESVSFEKGNGQGAVYFRGDYSTPKTGSARNHRGKVSGSCRVGTGAGTGFQRLGRGGKAASGTFDHRTELRSGAFDDDGIEAELCSEDGQRSGSRRIEFEAKKLAAGRCVGRGVNRIRAPLNEER